MRICLVLTVVLGAACGALPVIAVDPGDAGIVEPTLDSGVGPSLDAGVGEARYPPGIDPAQAKALQALIVDAAADSKVQPLTCSYSSTSMAGTPIRQAGLAFRLMTEAVSSGGGNGDANRDYSVLFETSARITHPDDSTRQIDPSNSLLVLYIPSIAPTLAVDGSTYDYAFHGYFTDRLVVRSTEGKASAIDFIKTDKQGAMVLLIECRRSLLR